MAYRMILVRSVKGDTFHLPECKVPGARIPWHWADDRTYLQVLEGIHGLGVYACARCLPPTYMPAPEDR